MASTYDITPIPRRFSPFITPLPRVACSKPSKPIIPADGISYDDFAKLMDSAFKPSPRSVKQMQETIIKYDKEKIFLLEVSISVAAFIGAIAIDRVMHFADLIKSSESDDKASQAGIVQMFGKDGKVRQMACSLVHKCLDWSSQMYHVCNDKKNPDFESRFADAIDYADETLRPLYDTASRLILKRLSTKTLSTPLDPVMLAALSTAIFSVDLAETFYLRMTAKCNFPEIKLVREYNFLRMVSVWDQLLKMLNYMDFLDTNGNPLKYNLRGMIESKPMQEIYTDMFHIFFSSEFIDQVCIYHSGIDYELRNSEFKSLIDSYEPYTKPLSYYKQKYSNN